jgi:hypothetical protein
MVEEWQCMPYTECLVDRIFRICDKCGNRLSRFVGVTTMIVSFQSICIDPNAQFFIRLPQRGLRSQWPDADRHVPWTAPGRERPATSPGRKSGRPRGPQPGIRRPDSGRSALAALQAVALPPDPDICGVIGPPEGRRRGRCRGTRQHASHSRASPDDPRSRKRAHMADRRRDPAPSRRVRAVSAHIGNDPGRVEPAPAHARPG